MVLVHRSGGLLVLIGALLLPTGCVVGVDDAEFGGSPGLDPGTTGAQPADDPPLPPEPGEESSGEGGGPIPPDDPVPDPPPQTTCGDGVRDPGEGCDGTDLGSESCEGFGFDGGTLECTADCKVVTATCFGCGNGTIDPGEPCDGADFGSETCESLGFGGGSLGCAADCSAIETGACDPPPVCGDGALNGAEECDATDFGSSTCATMGFTEGDLSCNGDCTLDTSQCVFVCKMAGEPCSSPTDCCNTGCGAGGANCIQNNTSVCCT